MLLNIFCSFASKYAELMRILHTADWHLGKRLDQNERTEEHFYFLNWLIESVSTKNIDLIIIAGDIFDTGNPPNSALKTYYDFLWQIKNTNCKNIVIVGGNHDSVTTLNAPKELLRFFNVHVVGGAPENIQEEIIEIKDAKGNTELIVCAVPFLRDRDLKLSIAGETSSEREERIKAGISTHYNMLLPYIKEYKEQHVPVIATGHLFAAGAKATPDSEKEIHIGNLGQIGGDDFPQEFDYIALGHLHRPQIVNKKSHIRYSGSPIALSFSENEDRKAVVIIDFENGEFKSAEELTVPSYRRLIRIKGDVETVKAKLSAIIPKEEYQLPSWIEIQVETEQFIFDLNEQLNSLIKERDDIGQLFIRQIRIKPAQNISEQVEESYSLQDLNPSVVFQKKCETEIAIEEYDNLKPTFDEALELMQQQNELK